MKLFMHSNGFLFAFGFDPTERKPDPHLIAWNDPVSGAWDAAADNQAGSMRKPFLIAPQFIREMADGTIIAYQPGRLIEMTYLGEPYVWGCRSLIAEDQS